MGDRMANLQNAVNAIASQCGTIEKSSSVYETAAWGKENQPNFYNQAIHLITSFAPEKLMQKLLQIEHELGRIRTEYMGPRVIDIDILLVENQIIQSEILTAPHPRLALRRFALIPLQEIAPTLEHTELHKTITELLRECPDKLEVQKINTN